MPNTLVDFRNLKNLTQKEMAKKLDITPSMYSKLELGLRNQTYGFLLKFKQVFKDASIEQIFFNN